MYSEQPKTERVFPRRSVIKLGGKQANNKKIKRGEYWLRSRS
jgi:hypothetical protein